jgi:hypothetical protein
MKMALDGSPRGDVEAHLREQFRALGDPTGLLDEVFERARRG